MQAVVLLLLLLDVLLDHRFVASDGGDEVSSGPEVLPEKITLTLAVNAGQMDRALTIDKTDHLGDGVFRRDRDHHVKVIRHEILIVERNAILIVDAVSEFSLSLGHKPACPVGIVAMKFTS